MNEKQRKMKQKAKKSNRNIRFYYSFLTVVLLICLVQVTRSALLNISKTLNYKVKVRKMMILREEAQQQHERLENDIKNFGNLKSLEAIARNNLKLAGEDEALVIINNDKTKQSIEVQEMPEADEVQENQQSPIKSSVWVTLKKRIIIK